LKIETEHSIGDPVWYVIWKDRETPFLSESICPLCDGGGHLQTVKGRYAVACPKCEGSGTYHAINKVAVAKQTEVTGIVVRLGSEVHYGDEKEPEAREVYYDTAKPYVLGGAGLYWSKEEAEQEAERRNKEVG